MNTKELEAQGYGHVSGGDLAGCFYKAGKYYKQDGDELHEVDASGARVEGADPIVTKPESDSGANGSLDEATKAKIDDLISNYSPAELYSLALAAVAELPEADQDAARAEIAEPAEEGSLGEGDVDVSIRMNAEFITKHTV